MRQSPRRAWRSRAAPGLKQPTQTYEVPSYSTTLNNAKIRILLERGGEAEGEGSPLKCAAGHEPQTRAGPTFQAGWNPSVGDAGTNSTNNLLIY
ncbi:hypothetical protein [Tortoise microvirus 93]|nr:hypothetical protein [Tortoise microvirus 93]